MCPPHPHASLPRPQKRTRHGSSRPLALRRRTIGESPSRVRYSTQSLISLTVPEPTLPLMYGSAPSSSHRAMNSWVPKWLFSSTLPQCVFTIAGRCFFGPMPSIQWYSSAKQPPGQRRFGMFKARSASTTSSRIPPSFGTSLSSPT